MEILDRLKKVIGCGWSPPPPPGMSSDPLFLESRLEDAQKRRRETFFRAPEVNRLTSKLHEEARRNHFGEAIDVAMQRRHA